jgi:hypothetical protein
VWESPSRDKVSEWINQLYYTSKEAIGKEKTKRKELSEAVSSAL